MKSGRVLCHPRGNWCRLGLGYPKDDGCGVCVRARVGQSSGGEVDQDDMVKWIADLARVGPDGRDEARVMMVCLAKYWQTGFGSIDQEGQALHEQNLVNFRYLKWTQSKGCEPSRSAAEQWSIDAYCDVSQPANVAAMSKLVGSCPGGGDGCSKVSKRADTYMLPRARMCGGYSSGRRVR